MTGDAAEKVKRGDTKKFVRISCYKRNCLRLVRSSLKGQTEVNVWLTQLIEHNEEAPIVIKGFGKRLKNKRQLKTNRKEQPTDFRQCTRISAE